MMDTPEYDVYRKYPCQQLKCPSSTAGNMKYLNLKHKIQSKILNFNFNHNNS